LLTYNSKTNQTKKEKKEKKKEWRTKEIKRKRWWSIKQQKIQASIACLLQVSQAHLELVTSRLQVGGGLVGQW
jgi:hypothetical protein